MQIEALKTQAEIDNYFDNTLPELIIEGYLPLIKETFIKARAANEPYKQSINVFASKEEPFEITIHIVEKEF